MFTDRFGNKLNAITGRKSLSLGTDIITLSWTRQGNVVTYNLDGNLASSSGSRYDFKNILPFEHDGFVSVISSFVGTTDLKVYGDVLYDGTVLALNLPKYGNALTIRSTFTVVVL